MGKGSGGTGVERVVQCFLLVRCFQRLEMAEEDEGELPGLQCFGTKVLAVMNPPPEEEQPPGRVSTSQHPSGRSWLDIRQNVISKGVVMGCCSCTGGWGGHLEVLRAMEMLL